MLKSFFYRFARRGRRIQTNLYNQFGYIKHNSRLSNIYYCCTQKTASQWFKSFFLDPMIYEYTGLKIAEYTQTTKRLQDVTFDEPYPENTFVVKLYLDYAAYLSLPKNGPYKTLFILRDPRDIVVSWYFSIRYSHALMGPIQKYRTELERLSLDHGLMYSIDRLTEEGLFDAQRSWVENAATDKLVQIFRYEDFTNDTPCFLQALFSYLEIDMGSDKFRALCDRHAFSRYSDGRERGTEETKSHYRKGISGDWIRYFTPAVSRHFDTVTDDLVAVLDYE